MCYCYGSGSDHFGPSAFNKLDWITLYNISDGQLLHSQAQVVLFCIHSRKNFLSCFRHDVDVYSHSLKYICAAVFDQFDSLVNSV